MAMSRGGSPLLGKVFHRVTVKCRNSFFTERDGMNGAFSIHRIGKQSIPSSSSSPPLPSLCLHGRSYATEASRRREVAKVEDPFDDAPTYNIPEKPVTFTEGASYTVVILAGLGIACAAGYAVFSELIIQPKEYQIYGKALDRVQKDGRVMARIGSPVTGYGQESRNRAARQRIPHRIWKDEDGVEHVEVTFNVRGPRGAGRVLAEMFKAPSEGWRFTYLIVDLTSPSPYRLMLESYIPP